MQPITKLLITLSCLVFGTSFIASSFANASDDPPVSGKIVGGQPAEKGQWPFMAKLSPLVLGQGCGAALIHPRYAVTASHCVGNISPQGLKVAIGAYNLNDNDGERIPVKNIFLAPPPSDYALLELTTPSTQPSLPLASPDTYASLQPGEMLITMGWGHLQEGSGLDPILRYVGVPFVDLPTCRALGYPYDQIGHDEICAGYKEGGKDSCQGDSGGPLIVERDGQYQHLGIVSSGEGCARPNAYGVYASTPHVYDWLQSQTHNIEFTQREFLGIQPQGTYRHTFVFRNHRDEAVYFDEPSVSDNIRLVDNRCQTGLEPQATCQIVVDVNQNEAQPMNTGELTVAVKEHDLILSSKVVSLSLPAAPQYRSTLDIAKQEGTIYANGPAWQRDFQHARDNSSLRAPELNPAETASIVIDDLPPGELTYWAKFADEMASEQLHVYVNGYPVRKRHEFSDPAFSPYRHVLTQPSNTIEFRLTPRCDCEGLTGDRIWLDAISVTPFEEVL
ncbi:S1 family peptidase [Vibrio ouci]|uniref:Serine protease n=1 Tax=Vibrio ouci TaxID=2499078 RepID=A0A4Y8WBE1_9VIBR|nr:serine protease [Vibrio ouci]TFH90260.1 serine protease [Vibrio ouci]